MSAALFDNSTHLPAPQHLFRGDGGLGADCCVVKLSTSGLGAVINFLVVGDKKYSAKIDTIGAALIDEGMILWIG